MSMIEINETYGKNARFDDVKPLNEEELRRYVPSIFNRDPTEDRSQRFEVIPTWYVVKALSDEGFGVVGARQSESRKGNITNTKHMLRLRRMDGKTYNVGDSVYEILLKNANNGTSCYEIMGGIFRIRCLNSLVSVQSQMESFKVMHVGDNVVGNVVDATYKVLNEAHHILDAPERWSNIKLDYEQLELYAGVAHHVRFGDTEGRPHPISPMQLIAPRREGDTGNDLWTIFNVVQENCIRGGIEGRGNNIKTREISAIDRSIDINRDLWRMTAKMAELV